MTKMNRRAFLTSAAAVAVMPPSVAPAVPVTETYANCPAGFALRSWMGDDGRSYNMVVPLPRYKEGSACRWTEYARNNVHNGEQGG